MESNHHQFAEEENNYPIQNNHQHSEDVNQNNPGTQKIEGFDEENAGNIESKIDETMRANFIIKVYGIVAFQLTISILFIACAFIPGYDRFLISTPGIVLFYISLSGALILAIILSCVTPIARRVPINYFLLLMFTVSESYILQYICSSYDYQSVLIAGLMTIGMVVTLSLYALRTKSNYTWKGALLFNVIIIFTISGIFTMFFWRSYLLQILYSFFGVLLFSCYLVFDIQLISGKFGVSFTIDDYIMAAMNVYLDIINIFLRLLEVFGSRQ